MMNNQFKLPLQMCPQQQQQMSGVNPQQFQQWLPNLNNNMLQQLVQQARQQGISEQDIKTGLEFLNQLRSHG